LERATEGLSFDFCRQHLAAGCVLSFLQDVRTRVQDFFPAGESFSLSKVFHASQIGLESFLISGQLTSQSRVIDDS
jgi:hypothetical protein